MLICNKTAVLKLKKLINIKIKYFNVYIFLYIFIILNEIKYFF
jgi:hypothetical protein